MLLEFPFSDLSRLQATLEELYGPRGGCGRGAAYPVAPASSYGLREFGTSWA